MAVWPNESPAVELARAKRRRVRFMGGYCRGLILCLVKAKPRKAGKLIVSSRNGPRGWGILKCIWFPFRCTALLWSRNKVALNSLNF